MRKIISNVLVSVFVLSNCSAHRIFADAADASEIIPLPSSPATPSPTRDPLPPMPEKGNAIPTPTPLQQEVPKPKTHSISAFTGKITKNKVRLRLQPSLDSPILRELTNGEMVVVTGENDEFFAIQPPTDIKGYIFRTFVLDGVVEGNHVNVRLDPDLTAPVIAQMNSGDRVNGIISSKDKKWIQMNLPESTRFYIAKDYVEKIGDAGYITKYNRRSMEVANLLSASTMASQNELQKPFNEINIDKINQDLQRVVSEYSDFPNEAAKAKELLATIQTAYLSKKVSYMENNIKQSPQPQAQVAANNEKPANQMSPKMATWIPVEQNLYNLWASGNGNASMDEYYQQQKENAIELKGVLEAYSKPIKNKPGDFVLLNASTHLPIGYLYSTQVNLQDRVGDEVTITVVPRDSRYFAYPAYFVLSIK